MQSILSFLRNRWYLVLIGAVILGGIIYSRSQSSKGPAYTYAEVSRETVEETLEVSGAVDAERKAVLRFIGGGKLVSLPFHEGDSVTKGQAIASIDARDLQKSLQRTLNDYVSDRLDFEQEKDDRKDTALTTELERLAKKQQNSLNNSVIDVELRSIALQNATLFSPLNGVITKQPVDITGVAVLASDTFEIVDPLSIAFIAEVDEVDIGKVETGQEVRIVLDAYPEDSITGYVGNVGLTAKASQRSSGGTVFSVSVYIPQAQITKHRIGMNGTMNVILQRKDLVLVVPVDATFVKDEKTFVRLVLDQASSKVEEKEVKTGISNEQYIEIVEGLSEGDQVAITK